MVVSVSPETQPATAKEVEAHEQMDRTFSLRWRIGGASFKAAAAAVDSNALESENLNNGDISHRNQVGDSNNRENNCNNNDTNGEVKNLNNHDIYHRNRVCDDSNNHENNCNNNENMKNLENSTANNMNGEVKNLNGVGAQEIEALMMYTYRASSPAHRKLKESPLSSGNIFRQSHAGLFNLCIVVLIAVNSRLIIENLMKYGLLIRAGFWFSSKSLRDWLLFMCCLTLPLFPLAAFLAEKLAKWKYLSDPVVVLLHVIITTASLLYPVLVILRCDSAEFFGGLLMLFACTLWLKLVSYAHANYDLRAIAKTSAKMAGLSSNVGISLNKLSQEDNSKKEIPYDVDFKCLVYFMAAPTLCYQTSYPRTPLVRKGWVARQLAKLVIFTGLMGFIIEQYINPIVRNSQHPLKGNLLYALERVLKLSVPNLYVWLCMFYCVFHLWLNILAEILRFGDREFYKDWWNARTFEEYWRMWNMPVHKWMVRHIYFPCLRNGIPKGVAILIAFLISAIFHELCIAVPCHIFKLWAFMGIMFQVPLGLLTNFLQKKFQNSMMGNMIFWFIFSIFGQPMCVLLYYHDLMNRKGKPSSSTS